MARVYTDTSNRQTANHAELIQWINEKIVECEIVGNQPAIARLVARMDVLLNPFKDDIFRDGVKKINDFRLPEMETMEEEKNMAATIAAYRTNELHRALTDLAYRRKFLPASANRTAEEMV